MHHWWTCCLICLALLGCDRNTSDSGKSGGGGTDGAPKISIVASVQSLADMAQRVAGSWADVTWLVEAGRRPEQVEGDSEARQRAGRAAAVLTAGPWDTWAQTGLSTDARAQHLIEPARMPSARDADPNAYLWLDPAVMRELVEQLRVRLGILDPKRDAALRAGAAAYTAEVDAVDREWAGALAPFKGRKVLLVRSVWGPMLARYGLESVVPVDVPEERLTAADFKERIVPAARAAGVKVIYVDEATPRGVRQQIESRTGLTVLTLDAVGTSATAGRNAWAKVMRYNLEQVRKGF
jgi:zinc transport system substrate-binding protein